MSHALCFYFCKTDGRDVFTGQVYGVNITQSPIMAVKCLIIKIHLDGESQNANDTNWFAVRFQCFWDIKTVESKMKLFESNGGFMEPSLVPHILG